MQEMYHAHTTERTLQSKATAIIECYFQSTVPPQLQLDISQSTASQVVNKPLGPYIFREAQVVASFLLAVFSDLCY